MLLKVDKYMYTLKEYMMVKEAAKFLGVCEMTLRRWDDSGKLKSYRHPVNKYRLYNKLQLENFLHEIPYPSSLREKTEKTKAELKQNTLMKKAIKKNILNKNKRT
jgi:excisionase family DNA binding protein